MEVERRIRSLMADIHSESESYETCSIDDARLALMTLEDRVNQIKQELDIFNQTTECQN